ncbi:MULTISPECIES: monofunctional biosynthetic peptidoglycan transglycosylase [Shewanella]|jgi:monofunctional glycosyltransferase|uniref:Biosynthetic peptidoglycan transglycosylase n=1 Tax=Shewanella baltica (strain OS195) TaxID=399599 RepID=A9L2Q0_SHEB9|nr:MULTISPECIES: monofunctional biosynthetic peptidoglycan transglycosylase [Shewanella]ABS07076.1 monofunctional biosynthetic peptidoglycan transglycosylase [Shewanella baltica OS185]ABX48132.1 monofunctional biosynthetic peptidoglycan transglycosylase [Shewanella baltica OS195]ACK45466.1 monofunctional biosynthetic peptidoglycan transglycosylase [Shewanella baltica OS223]ADT93162.1 monofunctional biosynthetic peptidoglycan transglycosylase [Shewanella baltica OS678]AEG10231.1 Monofunctional 
MTAPLYAMRDHVRRPSANKSSSPAPQRRKRGFRRLLSWLFKGLVWALICSILLVILLRFVNPPMWTWRIERALFPPAPMGEVMHQWRDLAHISPELQLAVIAAEDQRFAEHTGFDLAAISSALKYNQKGTKVRGASTLSQQAAKNLFMWSSRSFFRKGLEAWFTLMMELTWDKSRILEVYLNIVEFGPGIYGAEAASKHYFGKSAAKLTQYEASLLAAILPNPWRYKVSPPSSYVQQRSAWIRKQMRQLGDVTLKKVHEAG